MSRLFDLGGAALLDHAERLLGPGDHLGRLVDLPNRLALARLGCVGVGVVVLVGDVVGVDLAVLVVAGLGGAVGVEPGFAGDVLG